MITLVFDTETSDMVDFKAPLTAEHQPHLLQLGMAVFDENRYPIFEMGSLVFHPASLKINERAQEVHGISAEMCNKYGKPHEEVLETWEHWVEKADRVVAHNTSFDKQIMRIFYHRTGHTAEVDPFQGKQMLCTMRTLTPVLKIPGFRPGKFKWPQLSESYRRMVDPAGFKDAHNASVDVNACAQVLWACEDRGIIIRDAEYAC